MYRPFWKHVEGATREISKGGESSVGHMLWPSLIPQCVCCAKGQGHAVWGQE